MTALELQIARIRSTGATYHEALRRIALAQVLQDKYEAAQAKEAKAVQAKEAKAVQAFDKRTLVALGPLRAGSYRRRKK